LIVDRILVVRKAKQCLDAYLQPSHIIRYSSRISFDTIKKMPESSDATGSITMHNSTTITDPMVKAWQAVVQEMVDLDCVPAPDTNFFHIGGSSMLASQLASRIRKQYEFSFATLSSQNGGISSSSFASDNY
jgi:hypothetical protein